MCNIKSKDVDGYEGKYKIYQNGEVYSYGIKRNLKHSIDKAGYHRVGLSKNGESKIFMVHRLVGFAFMSEDYKDGFEINHEDANKGNNWDWNLTWNTHQYNMNHVSDNSLHGKTIKCCLVDDDGNVLKIYPSMKIASNDIGVNDRPISKSCYGISNDCLGNRIRIYNETEEDWIRTKFDKIGYKYHCTRGQKIYCEENEKIYDSQIKASEDLGIPQCKISNYLNKGIKCGFTLKRL